jgi:outer membrane biosynthesis protein TonB
MNDRPDNYRDLAAPQQQLWELQRISDAVTRIVLILEASAEPSAAQPELQPEVLPEPEISEVQPVPEALPEAPQKRPGLFSRLTGK